jgi:hypothetical protein
MVHLLCVKDESKTMFEPGSDERVVKTKESVKHSASISASTFF